MLEFMASFNMFNVFQSENHPNIEIKLVRTGKELIAMGKYNNFYSRR